MELATRPRQMTGHTIKGDLYQMARIVLWLAFLLLMTPIAAAILRTVARIAYGINLD
jgi:hypothetical protein